METAFCTQLGQHRQPAEGGQRWDLAWICLLDYLCPKPFHGLLCFNFDLILIGLDNPQAESVRALCTCQTLVANASGLPSHWQTLLTCASIIPPDADALLVTIAMSLSLPTTSSSNLQAIFDIALKEYERKTKKVLSTDPLMAQLQACDSPSAILTLLHSQRSGSTSSDERLTNWLIPTVNVLSSFSATLGQGIGLVNSILAILLRSNL